MDYKQRWLDANMHGKEQIVDEMQSALTLAEQRLKEAEKVIDSASTDFCSNMSEYKQKDCTEIPLLEFDWCTHCMAMAYRMKYPKA